MEGLGLSAVRHLQRQRISHSVILIVGFSAVAHRLESKPMLALAVCHVGGDLALELLNEQTAEVILNDCEQYLGEG